MLDLSLGSYTVEHECLPCNSPTDTVNDFASDEKGKSIRTKLIPTFELFPYNREYYVFPHKQKTLLELKKTPDIMKPFSHTLFPQPAGHLMLILPICGILNGVEYS